MDSVHAALVDVNERLRKSVPACVTHGSSNDFKMFVVRFIARVSESNAENVSECFNVFSVRIYCRDCYVPVVERITKRGNAVNVI